MSGTSDLAEFETEHLVPPPQTCEEQLVACQQKLKEVNQKLKAANLKLAGRVDESGKFVKVVSSFHENEGARKDCFSSSSLPFLFY